jgi:F-type H+-transporting ATPase subunit delta
MTKAEENENKIVAQRYANALMEFSGEKLSKEDIFSQIKDVQTSLNNSDDLQKVMSSPIVSNDEKKGVINKIFGNNINEIILNFLNFLIDKNRFNIFNSIVKEYKNELNRQNGLLEIKIVSAIELNDNEKAMIKVKLQKILNKEIELDWATDSSLIGGLVFEAGDNIVDCSLQHKLQEINKEITI